MPKNELQKKWLQSFNKESGWKDFKFGGIDLFPLTLEPQKALPEIDDVKVMSRFAFGEEGYPTKVIIAGRPASKHNGKQGQHTTAFSVSREAICRAISASEDINVAKKNIANLFSQLQLYPQLKGEENKAIANSISDYCDVELWPDGKSLEVVASYYLEVRDALKGASLPGEKHTDTTSGGEPQALAELRGIENWLLEDTRMNVDGDDLEVVRESFNPDVTPLTHEDFLISLKCFGTLIDLDAVMKLGAKDRADQFETFILSLSQAFPAVFLAKESGSKDDRTVGSDLCESIASALQLETNQEFNKDEISDLAMLTAFKNVPDFGTKRLDIKVFSSELRWEDKDEDGNLIPRKESTKLSLKFSGRPESSIKEGGTMGDHTSAFREVTTALANHLLSDGKVPTGLELSKKVKTILDDFSPSNSLNMFPKLRDILIEELELEDYMEEQYDWNSEALKTLMNHAVEEREDEETPTRYEKAIARQDGAYIMRLVDFTSQHSKLEKLVNSLPKNSRDPVDDRIFLNMAEECVSYLDQRPSSVVYGAPAVGHGEGVTGKKLDEMEASGENKPDDFFNLAMGQMDCAAVQFLGDMDDTYPILDGDRFRQEIINEFIWFMEKSYSDQWSKLCKTLHSSTSIYEEVDRFISYWQNDRDSKNTDFIDDYQFKLRTQDMNKRKRSKEDIPEAVKKPRKNKPNKSQK